MFSSLSSVVQLILAGVVGLLIGLLVASLFSREPKTPGEPVLPKEFTDEGYSEAARLLYSPSTKKVVIQLDGDFYREFMQLTPEQKKRVLRLLQSWNEWSGYKPAAAAELDKPASFVTPPAFPVEAPKTEAIPKSAFAPGAFSEFDTIVKQSLSPDTPAIKEDLSDLGIVVPTVVEPVPAVVKIGQPTAVKAKTAPLTIVDQINEMIDHLAAGTPQESRRIHLAENDSQGVVVWVGLEHFDGVDSVPYPEVKELLKAAVARWEEENEERK